MILDLTRRAGQVILAATLLAGFSLPGVAADATALAPSSPLDRGFRLMYDLDFDQAHQVFASWQQEHPDDPVGLACDAAGLLFSEFNRLGVLEAQFYADDRTFDRRKKLSPDPVTRDRLNAELTLAESKARARLAQDGKDRDALFAMTLAAGLRADYAALVEKSNFTALRYTKESAKWAEQLLAVDPDCYDAHLASGISQYIIGSVAAPVRWLLRLGGVSGNKKAGLEELQVTAQRGRYLAPFARILLAIAYVRDKDKAKAREMLESLRGDFPSNPLFARELARLETGP
jgi:hypothetical protein